MKKNFLTTTLAAAMLAAVVLSPSCTRQNNMTYSINPYSGDKVSLLGYGCMRFPMIENEDGQSVVDQEAVNKLIDKAIAGGINFFDCSPMYLDGQCESATGIALKRHKREDFFVSTKLSNYRDYSLEAGKAMYYKSFEELQVDYIDYYFLHGVGNGADAIATLHARYLDNGLLEFLLEEKAAGRIRNLGWSFHGDVAVFDTMFKLGVQWDFAMIQMNYMDWQHASGRNVNAEYLYHKMIENEVPILVMEPLFGGRLADLSPLAKNVLNEVTPNATPANWAFRYVGSFEGILTILSGMNKTEHIAENIKTFSPLKPLNDAEFEAIGIITEIMTTAGFISCTGCDYCTPCPFGVDIPAVFIRYNEYISQRKEIDKNDPVLQQASLCDNCGECEGKCPQRIGIVKMLAKIDSIVRSPN